MAEAKIRVHKRRLEKEQCMVSRYILLGCPAEPKESASFLTAPLQTSGLLAVQGFALCQQIPLIPPPSLQRDFQSEPRGSFLSLQTSPHILSPIQQNPFAKTNYGPGQFQQAKLWELHSKVQLLYNSTGHKEATVCTLKSSVFFLM